MKPLRCLTASVALVGLLAGPAAAEVTLDVLYAFPSFARFHEPLAKEFMARQSEIKIQFRAPAASYDEGHQTMLRQAMTNQLPDVYYSGYHLLGELVRTLVKREQIVDLGPLLAAEGEAFRKANYSERILDLGKVDGKLYGLAFNASSPIMYYNVDLVRKAGGDPEKMPDTWNGVVELAKKIRAQGADVNGMAYDVHGWPDDWLWRAMILQAGGKMLNDAGTEVAFGGEIGLNALKMARRFVTDGGMQLIDWDQSRQQFAAGKIGIYFASPANLRQITDLVGNKFALRTTTFPIDNKQAGGLPTGGNAALITSRDPAKQKAAWQFLKFVSSAEAQKIVVEMTGYLPTNIKALDKEYLGGFYDANPNFRAPALQVERALPWDGYPGGNAVRIWRNQRDIITAVMRGETTPEAGLDRMVKETNAMMK
jgi:multiple sugar transport system substrate-binding protein